jgi:hypothetical protein
MRRRRSAALVVALVLGALGAGCGTPKYRYHFSTKGGAERFPRDRAPAPTPDAGAADSSAGPPTSSAGTAPR